MAWVTTKQGRKEYAEGTTWFQIAKEHQQFYENDILLVKVDGKLQELHKKVWGDCNVEFLTAKDKPGMMTYQRSAYLLMLKAFYDVAGNENVEKVFIDCSIGKGFFIEAEGNFELNQEFLDRVKEKMREFVEQKLPIKKRNINTDDAIALFARHRMYDKELLFRYRRVSRVNIYNIGGFEDYYYGYMAPDTGYIKYFDLIMYHHGFVLMLPELKAPTKVPEFFPQEKLFHELYESSKWGQRLGVSTVGALNEQIAQGRMNQLILIQEALQEKKIGEIAEQIAAARDRKFIMIAGPSSSGKTTFSHRLSIQLEALGLHPHPIAVDDYFVNRVNSPRDADGNYNFEVLESIDLERFNQDMEDLLKGKTVDMPHFNFKTGLREYNGDYLTLGKDDILVIEGIHCLNDRLSYSLPRESKFKIYISSLTQLNVDEHNRIPTTDARLLRRMVRDARTRGTSAQNTIKMWPKVRKGEEENIFPFQEEADVMFNSALVYELSVLKQYAEPLLFGIPADSEEYLEAKRLLKFLDYFLGISSEDIPKNSIVREFIGGSCFKV